MRAETQADIEGAVKVQVDRRTQLVHWLTLQAGDDRDGIPVLLNANPFGQHALQSASEPVLHIRHHGASLRTLRKVDHAAAVLADHGLLGVVIQILANDQDDLSVVIALRIWKCSIGRKRGISVLLLPDVTELIARVPDVVSGGADGVSLGAGVIRAATRHQGRSNIRLAIEYAGWDIEVFAGAMKVCRRRHLLMC
jgi:hypothetical protein